MVNRAQQLEVVEKKRLSPSQIQRDDAARGADWRKGGGRRRARRRHLSTTTTTTTREHASHLARLGAARGVQHGRVLGQDEVVALAVDEHRRHDAAADRAERVAVADVEARAVLDRAPDHADRLRRADGDGGGGGGDDGGGWRLSRVVAPRSLVFSTARAARTRQTRTVRRTDGTAHDANTNTATTTRLIAEQPGLALGHLADEVAAQPVERAERRVGDDGLEGGDGTYISSPAARCQRKRYATRGSGV